MLLTGTHPRSLDEKKRLTLPKRLRGQLGDPETLFLTPGPDQSIWLYTEAELERLAERLDRAPAADAQARVFRRLYFAQTEAADLDRSGRMVVPERLAKFAGLAQEVVLIGVRDHLELWDHQRWDEYLEGHASGFDSFAEQAFRDHEEA